MLFADFNTLLNYIDASHWLSRVIIKWSKISLFTRSRISDYIAALYSYRVSFYKYLSLGRSLFLSSDTSSLKTDCLPKIHNLQLIWLMFSINGTIFRIFLFVPLVVILFNLHSRLFHVVIHLIVSQYNSLSQVFAN